MLIQCLVPRRTGTPIKLSDGTSVPFKPNDQGDHVCEVKDKEHIKQLLAHKGYYRPYNSEKSALEKEAAEAARKKKEKEAKNKGADTNTAPNPDANAGGASGEGNENAGADGPGAGSPGPDDVNKSITEDALNAMDMPALADLFEKSVGRKPHPATSKEKIVKALLANQKKRVEPGSE
jgi:hypothetical protein